MARMGSKGFWVQWESIHWQLWIPAQTPDWQYLEVPTLTVAQQLQKLRHSHDIVVGWGKHS